MELTFHFAANTIIHLVFFSSRNRLYLLGKIVASVSLISMERMTKLSFMQPGELCMKPVQGGIKRRLNYKEGLVASRAARFVCCRKGMTTRTLQ